MTREDIIHMAREVWPRAVLPFPELERFAALVAAAAKAEEREACAKVCEDIDFNEVLDAVEYAHVFAAAIRARQSL